MCRTGGPDGAATEKLAVEYNTIDLGMLYRINKTTRIGLMAKNLVGFSFKKKYSSFALPKYVTLGLSKQWKQHTLALDNEFIFGKFGGPNKKRAEIWFLRAGLESKIGRYFRLRGGIIYPVIAKTSSLGDLKDDIPDPKFGGSVGFGLVFKHVNIDFALYGDPAKSYVERNPVLSATGTLTLKF